MKFDITTNDIRQKGELKTGIDGWENDLYRMVKECVKNRFCHNRVRNIAGETIFVESDYLAKRNAIIDKHTTLRPFTEDEIYLGKDRYADGKKRPGMEVVDESASAELAELEKKTIDDIYLMILADNGISDGKGMGKQYGINVAGCGGIEVEMVYDRYGTFSRTRFETIGEACSYVLSSEAKEEIWNWTVFNASTGKIFARKYR